MKNPWTAFYWNDYSGDTSHLTMMEHGAYFLLLSHYYVTGKPLDANASLLHRVCRAFADAEKSAVDSVLGMFFTLKGGHYHNARADKEIAKSTDIRIKRSKAASCKWNANAMQVHTQPQPQSQSQKEKVKSYVHFVHPTLEEVSAYCRQRGNSVDPEKWMAHYEANGWKVGRNPMKNWKAAVHTWETTRSKPTVEETMSTKELEFAKEWNAREKDRISRKMN